MTKPAGENSEPFSSQFGEDEFLIKHRHLPQKGVFVDVGAGDPVRFSNTYYLEQLGWAGVCIDADPKQIEALRRLRTCAVEWAAVTSDDGEVELLQCDDPDYSTTLDHLPELAAERGWGYALTRVPALKLETILNKHGIETINLLSIDTEGNELDVCDTLDWDRHRPRVVVIEYLTWGRPSQETVVRNYFAGLPYRLIHRTRSNLIFSETWLLRPLRRNSSRRAYLAKRNENGIPPGIGSDSAPEGPATLPTISVVTPSFNRKEYLAETIESVLGQNYPKLEYVVVDGGSTDGSAEMIAERAGELAWSVSEPDGGAWEAINKGFAHTSGEVMGWLGSDDLLMPWALSVIGELFATFPQIEWLTTLYPIVCDENGRAVACSYRAAYSREGFFRGDNLPEAGWPAADFIMQESTYWRRSLWERAGGRVDESLRLAVDFELWARFHRADARLYGVATPLAGFRMHGDQKSQTDRPAYIEEARDVFFRYGGKPQHPLVAGLRLALARAMPRRFQTTWPLSRLLPPQPPICVHYGPGVGWRIENS